MPLQKDLDTDENGEDSDAFNDVSHNLLDI